ncbi:hypothetical protein GFS31_18390 [Leptolyngbya sp. BL0902]|uniref:DUF3153 domain-containing protein n=1 Tax=Leptolyngbya sp. BL0902 TaxID=1115757 RepID=UPI0018E6E6B0|nr:DUF3153 domain-containing protein [Leptolyngbya sp. BL0902]QQE65154.1 hypothetical protein GFS31_18390 [Leptolyngbya sp. BL0902]
MRGCRWRLWRLGLWVSLVWLLGGCFQADLTLQFDHHHHGSWTQTLTLGERNLAFIGDALDPWLAEIRPSVQRFGGQIRQTPSRLDLTVPFSTPADLASRFKDVFSAPLPESLGVGAMEATAGRSVAENSAAQDAMTAPLEMAATDAQLALPGLGIVPFRLEAQEQNWGLFSHVHLTYDLDLRAVEGVVAAATQAEPTREDWVSFRLRVPWGLRSVASEALAPVRRDAHGAQWNLPLGQQIHIDVGFWLPNGVGLGGLALALMVLLGYGLRYRWLGPPRS